MYLLVGSVCLIYYILICLCLRRWNSTFSRFWLGFGILFLGISQIPSGSTPELIIRYGILLLSLVFLVTAGVIIMGMFSHASEEYHCIIVLGAQVRGKRITDSLLRRLKAALNYLNLHPDTYVIVSGGQGKGEDMTEAEAMEQYLLRSGIEKARIIKEDRSRTTEENLKFSMAYVKDADRAIGIASNNFHVYRACFYAKRIGIRKPYPLAAGCHPVLFVNYLVRECMAVWKMFLKLWLTKKTTVL